MRNGIPDLQSLRGKGRDQVLARGLASGERAAGAGNRSGRQEQEAEAGAGGRGRKAEGRKRRSTVFDGPGLRSQPAGLLAQPA